MPQNSNATLTKGTRAKHACRACNARRVRCDVMEVHPCSNCEKSGESCELVPSRRGKYPRRPKQQVAASSPLSSGSVADVSMVSMLSEDIIASAEAVSTRRSTRLEQHRGGPQIPASSTHSLRSGGSGRIFLGESNFFSLVASPPQGGEERAAEADGRPAAGLLPTSSPTAAPPADMGHLSASTARHLRDEGALTCPDVGRSMPALTAYFDWFHPCFPVLDRSKVSHQLATGNISHLLLMAILFVGITYCEEDTISAMGFSDLSEAKALLYHRAKLLFQADVEKDRITVIQSVFLLSFWRSSATDVCDVRYWLGVAITLAESQGLHRSARITTKDSQLARIQRRIWWSIYVRERQAATSLGLPCRIRESDCDVESLSASDLESVTPASGPSPFGVCKPEHITYSIKMLEVAKMLGKVVDFYFAPGRPPPQPDDARLLDDNLEASRLGLPDDFREVVEGGKTSVWACLLHLAYNHVRLLIYQGTILRQSRPDYDNQSALNAASQISRIAEDMLMQGTIRYGQLHLITSLFASLCVHAINTHKVTGISQTISKHRAQMCVLGLQEVNKYWMVNVHMLDYFLRYLEDPSTQPPRGAQPGTRQQLSDIDAPSRQLRAEAHPDDATVPDRNPNDLFPDQYFNMIYGPWGGEGGLSVDYSF